MRDFGSTSEFSKALTVVPTAVTLLSFSAEARDGAVDLSWTTASELSNLGFHLYRAEAAGGPYTRITTSLVPGLGSSPMGQSYSYRDAGLVNGRTYHYQLEDVDTTGRTERHGPVSAAPRSERKAEAPGSRPTAIPRGCAGEIERDSGHVLLELLTPGFVAVPTGDGRVRLSIPGFASASGAGEPDLPSRRALVEATAGKKVHLASVTTSDELRFPGLRPTAQGAPRIEVDESGTVLPFEEQRREGRGFDGIFPPESAHLLGLRSKERARRRRCSSSRCAGTGAGSSCRGVSWCVSTLRGRNRRRGHWGAREGAGQWLDPGESGAGSGLSSW